MFSVILKVLLALTSLSLSIYLFQLKDRYPDLTKSGWNRVLSGVLLLFGFSLIEILDEFPQAKAVIFGSPVIPLFLEVVFGILGLILIIFGMVNWLTEMSFLKKKSEDKESEFLFLENLASRTRKSSTLIETLEISITEEILMELKRGDFVSLAVAPILAAEKIIGVLALFSRERYKLDSKLENLLQNISSNLGEKIDTLRLAKEVKRRTDKLTQ